MEEQRTPNPQVGGSSPPWPATHKKENVKVGKKVVVIADLHCGHRTGLTPPKYQNLYPDMRYVDIQKNLWQEFKKMVDKQRPVDILIVNGDAIEGIGSRSGGTELITTDRNIQCDMAVEVIEFVDPKRVFMTVGTAYHTGNEEDWEKQIADRIGANIEDHIWLDINGVIFDIKHHIGNTTVPYSKGTQISKDRLWNLIWSEYEEQPKSDVLLRSHVHQFFFCGEDNWLGIITPALQGQGTKFGARRRSNTVHFGIVWFDINDKGIMNWGWDIIRGKYQKAEAIKV